MNNQLMAIIINQITKGWVTKDSKDNALATATKAAAAGKTHVITGIMGSFSATKTGLVQIKDGATVIAEVYIVNSGGYYPLNITGTVGNAVSAELAASGAAGNIGKINLLGFTI